MVMISSWMMIMMTCGDDEWEFRKLHDNVIQSVKFQEMFINAEIQTVKIKQLKEKPKYEIIYLLLKRNNH